MPDLGIRELAAQTGLAAGTIRMWEQRYGFPEPARTPSGYRRYRPRDVEILRRALGLREEGLSVGAALERARAGASAGGTDRPSIYASVLASERMPMRPRGLHKRTLIALSRAIEDEAMSSASSPVCFAGFQRQEFFRPAEHRYERIARTSDATIVFADFDEMREGAGGLLEIPLERGGALEDEWVLVVDAPGFAACLLAWERPGDPESEDGDLERRFESLWTLDPVTVRSASRAGAAIVARSDARRGEELEEMLAERPLALERPTPALTGLTNRVVEYLD